MTYLGIPISDRTLNLKDFKVMTQKMRKKLQPWKCKHLSYGGRLILTNSSLSSVPTYLIGMFQLFEGTHQEMDSMRANFFWGDTNQKKKYHMMKWENLCIPKDFGGRGG
jgi:hypothetical protein